MIVIGATLHGGFLEGVEGLRNNKDRQRFCYVYCMTMCFLFSSGGRHWRYRREFGAWLALLHWSLPEKVLCRMGLNFYVVWSWAESIYLKVYIYLNIISYTCQILSTDAKMS